MATEDKADVMHAESKGLGADHDVALDIIGTGDLNVAIDPAEERRLVRKIDWRVMPFICITYLVTYIDKATIGYAAVFNLQTDLNLVGTQYSWLGSIFYFGYLVVGTTLTGHCYLWRRPLF